MTDETTPDATAGEPTTAPRARRSRRATAPASAPSVGAASPDAAPAEAQAVPVDAEPARTTAPRTRSRRKTAPPVTEAPAEVAAASEPVLPEPAPAEPAPAQAEPAAPRARRSRRATSATVAAAAEQPAPDTAEPDATPAPEPVAAEAPDEAPARTGRARSTTRRSRAKAPAAPEQLEAVDAGEPAATAEPAAAPEPAGEPALDVLAELGAPRSSAPTGDRPPRLAATALLFQAPEPQRTRRRRAQAPAGPPLAEDLAAEDETVLAEDEEALEAAGVLEGSEDLGPVAPGQTDDADDEAQDDAQGDDEATARRRRRRGGRGRRSRGGADRPDEDQDDATPAEGDAAADQPADADADAEGDDEGEGSTSRRRRRRRRGSRGEAAVVADEPAPSRTRSRSGRTGSDEVTALKGSTRLEAKRQRRREGRDAGRRRAIITEAEFLARREAVDRTMVVREQGGRVQIAVLEDDVLVEHFVSRTSGSGQSGSSMAGNVYLGRVQNVLPSMEAAFVDIGKGRNAVLYAGEVNWDAAGLEGQPRRIEQALKSGDSVLVQVTKDPIGHKGARLTSQITLAGRYLVYVPAGGMTGISRKLPENERARLKKLLKEIVPDAAGVIVRTAAEGASEEELRLDVQRLQDQWAAIEKKAKSASAPALLQGEPDLAIRVVRDIFNDDFGSLVVQGDGVWSMIREYVDAMAPDLADRVTRWAGVGDVFAAHRVDEQLAKGMDRKVWLPSGGSLVIDRTEAMTVVDVNTGKFTGSGGTLEETVTRNNLEAAEEIVRQLRLRDIGGIIVIDFIDMVLESNRDLVLRRLVECLGRDRTKHQVAEVTSLGLVQMTRKRVGQGLVEAFSETCVHCNGRGFIVHNEPVERSGGAEQAGPEPVEPTESKRSRRKKATSPTGSAGAGAPAVTVPVLPEAREAVKATLATIAAAAAHAHEHPHGEHEPVDGEHGHDDRQHGDEPDLGSAEHDHVADDALLLAAGDDPASVVVAGPEHGDADTPHQVI